MKIVHHIAMRLRTDEQRAAFRALGFDLAKGSIVSFEIAEDDPRWKRVTQLVKRFRASDSARTVYSEADLSAASPLGMLGSSPKGFPQPSGNFGYLAKTYDLSNYCDRCGCGAHQIAPFILKAIPKLKNSVLQLNWINDEFFVDRAAWHHLFSPFGIGFRPVLHKNGMEVDHIVQLDISTKVDVRVNELDVFKDCPVCGRRKYWIKYVHRPYPPPMNTEADIYRSNQYFGDGLEAFNLVYISNRLFSEIKSAGLRGLAFQTIAKTSKTG